MVELIYDDDFERRWIDRFQVYLGQRLDRREHVLPFVGAMSVYVELAEGPVAKHHPEHRPTLCKQLTAVSNEKQPRSTVARALALIIERGDNRLARACGGNDQVSKAPMPLSDRKSVV